MDQAQVGSDLAVELAVTTGRGRMRSRGFVAGLLAGALLFVAAPGWANTITFGLNVEFSNGQAPGGPTPWVTAVFDDSFGGPNTVRLTMSATNLLGNGGGAEFINEMSFNFDPALDPTQLSITLVSAVGIGNTVVSTGVDAFQADGDGFFDIMFDFPQSNSRSGRFTNGEVAVYDITYTGPIDASSFNFFSVMGGGQGTFLAAAHINNATGPGSGGSGWIGVVPEPSTALLLAGGLLGLGWLGRRS